MELKKIYQFSNLSDNLLEEIKQHITTKEYKKGNVVFFEGERGRNINILTKGLLRVYKTDPKGNEITIHLFAEATMVAEMPIFEGIPYPASARFESDGQMMFIEYEKFKKILERDSTAAFGLIKSLIRKIKFLENNMSNIMGRSASDKVAKFLYENEEILSQINSKTIAGAVNITPETLSRELKKLKGQEIVKVVGREIIVIDKDSLRKRFSF